jgi:hypothetical protein
MGRPVNLLHYDTISKGNFELSVESTSFPGTYVYPVEILGDQYNRTVKFSLPVSPIVFNLSQIPDNTLKLGDDFFDMSSNAMSDPTAAIPINSLLQVGPNQNKAYFKFGGHWYSPFDLTSDQLFNPAYALTEQQEQSISGFNKWYKSGGEVEDLR